MNFKIDISAFSLKLVVLAVSLNIHSIGFAEEISYKHICNSEGAFGMKFGEKFTGPGVQGDSFHFGRGCYLIDPAIKLEQFDMYAVCISKSEGEIYQIQAGKNYDKEPPEGSLKLTDAQVQSNRERGQKTLDEVLAMFPKELSERAEFSAATRSWELAIDDEVTLEVSNMVSWAASLECKHNARASQNFRERMWGR